MNIPWMLVVLGLTALGAIFVEPKSIIWLIIATPALIVIVPTLFPLADRKINRTIDAAKDRRRQVDRARSAKPSDPTAGLSFPTDDAAGTLAVVDEPSEPTSPRHID